jgi:hypothetical protein
MSAEVLQPEAIPFSSLPANEERGPRPAIVTSILQDHRRKPEAHRSEGATTRVDVHLPLPEGARA